MVTKDVQMLAVSLVFLYTMLAGFSAAVYNPSCLLVKKQSDVFAFDPETSTAQWFLSIPEARPLKAIDVHFGEEYIFWIDSSHVGIQRSHIDGANKEVIINELAESYDGLAVDWKSSLLYFITSRDISVADLNGNNRRLLVSISLASNLKIDPDHGSMFWEDIGNIETATLNGTQQNVIVSSDVATSSEIDLDRENKRIFWFSLLSGLRSADYNGENKKTLVPNNFDNNDGPAFSPPFLYFTNSDGLHKLNATTGDFLDNYTGYNERIFSVVAFNSSCPSSGSSQISAMSAIDTVKTSQVVVASSERKTASSLVSHLSSQLTTESSKSTPILTSPTVNQLTLSSNVFRMTSTKSVLNLPVTVTQHSSVSVTNHHSSPVTLSSVTSSTSIGSSSMSSIHTVKTSQVVVASSERETASTSVSHLPSQLDTQSSKSTPIYTSPTVNQLTLSSNVFPATSSKPVLNLPVTVTQHSSVSVTYNHSSPVMLSSVTSSTSIGSSSMSSIHTVKTVAVASSERETASTSVSYLSSQFTTQSSKSTSIYTSPTVNQLTLPSTVIPATSAKSVLNLPVTVTQQSSVSVTDHHSSPVTLSSVTSITSIDTNYSKRKADLVAIIFGGNEVVRGHNMLITINASLSYDPDVGPGDYTGMNFTWYLGQTKGNYTGASSVSVSLEAVNETYNQYSQLDYYDQAITFNTSSMFVNKSTYVFKVVVSKDSRNSSFIQVMHLVKGDPPEISQRCQINCGLKINPSVKLSIKSRCQGRCSDIVSYEWRLYEECQTTSEWQIIQDLRNLTRTPLNSSGIVIREDRLGSGRTYRLELFVQTSYSVPGRSAYDIITASAPSGGTCTIAPLTGVSLNTSFSLSCYNWTSDNTPLSYQIQYQLEGGMYSVVYEGFNNSVITWLPPGNSSDIYTLKLVVLVTDKLGVSAPEVHMSVQVTPYSLLSPNDLTEFVTANNSLFSNAIKDGRIDIAVKIANAVLQELSNDSTVRPDERIKIKDFIIEKTVVMPVNDIQGVLQCSSLIGLATQDVDTVSVTSLFTCLFAVDTMTSFLANSTQIEDIPLITKAGINLGFCLSNIMKAGSVLGSDDVISGPEAQGKELVTRSAQLVGNVSDALLDLTLPDEEIKPIDTGDMVITLGRHSISKVAGLKIEGGYGGFVLPAEKGTLESIITNTSFLNTQMWAAKFNPFTWNVTSRRVNSNVLTLDLKDDRRRVIKVSNLSSEVLIALPLKPSKQSSENSRFFSKADKLRFHVIEVDQENTLIQLKIAPEEANVNLNAYLRYRQRPTKEAHDLNVSVSRNGRCVWEKRYGEEKERSECTTDRLAPIETLAKNAGKYFLAVQSMNTSFQPKTRQKRSCFGNGRQKRSCVEIKDAPPTPPLNKNVTVVPDYDPTTDKNYTLRVSLASCVYWSEEQDRWTADGCVVSSVAPNGFLNCSCNHLTSFGGSLFIEPNPIDFDEVLVGFKTLEETGNVTVIVAVAIVILIYCAVLVIARRADKVDARNNCPSVELPAPSSYCYKYQITINTGVWRNSGSTAKIAMEIYGAEGNSRVFQLCAEADENLQLFCRGNKDVFVFRSDKSLGVLRELRIGHDNTGDSPSWFLEDVFILDLQINRSWTFSNSQWLALERGDGRIERVLAPSQIDFKKEVSKRWWKGLTEKHIWISTTVKPSRNHFTRVQRASCCVSVFLSAMLANAMFYQFNGKSEQVIQVGPLKFSGRQVIIGIQSAVVVAPINILIIFMFQNGSKKSSNQTPRCSRDKWFIFFAWFLWFCLCIGSAALSIFYSLVWGKSISEQWLTSMLVSFVQDVTINEPAKLLLLALFWSIILRRKKIKHTDNDSITYGNDHQNNTITKTKLFALHLTDVEGMRKRQAKKENLSRFHLEIVTYSTFLFTLLVICYGGRNGHRYIMIKSIRDAVGSAKFDKVSSDIQFWIWLRQQFLPSVYAGEWYNGQKENQTVYIGNKHSLLVGMPRARQLRIKNSSCDVLDSLKPLFPVCYYAYSKANEDKTPYHKPGWIPIKSSTTREELFRLCPKPWRYQGAEETDTVPKWGQFSLYQGGGFVADLGYESKTASAIVQTLQNNYWLDQQTRAIILSFSAFNPSTNLLAVISLFYETQRSGLTATFERIDVLPLYSKETGFHQFYLICILLFTVLVFIYLGKECYNVYRQRSRYFISIWNWVEILQVLLSILVVSIHLVKSNKISSTIRKLQENVYANVTFQEAIIWTEAENAVLGFLSFTVTAKLLRFFRFNRQVAIFLPTLRISGKELLSSCIILMIGFMAFLHFGILIFGNGTEFYSSPLKATYFQLELILGKVKARPINDLADANDKFGRIFAGLLLFSLTIVFMNLYISSLNKTLSDVKQTNKESGLYQLVDDESFQKRKKSNAFFEAISVGIKQMRLKGKSALHFEERKTLDDSSENRTTVNYDVISRAMVSLKNNKSHRRNSFFNRISNSIFSTNRKRMTSKNTTKRPFAFKKKKVRFAEDEFTTKLKKLQKKKRVLVRSFESSLEGYFEEEFLFDFVSEKWNLMHS